MIAADLILPCRTTDPEVFFAPHGQRRGSSEYTQRVTLAKGLCAECPITDACREEGRQQRAYGVWGGEDEYDREDLGFTPANVSILVLVDACGTEAGAARHRRAGENPCQPCLDAAALANRERKAARLERAA